MHVWIELLCSLYEHAVTFGTSLSLADSLIKRNPADVAGFLCDMSWQLVRWSMWLTLASLAVKLGLIRLNRARAI